MSGYLLVRSEVVGDHDGGTRTENIPHAATYIRGDSHAA